MLRLLMKLYYVLTAPIAILLILGSTKIHPAYGMSWYRKYHLGLRMFVNTLRIPTETSFKAHLAMALKILEAPPDVPGDVVECGTWKGGSAVNLSLVCRIVGRRLIVYDSFEGLPAPDPRDREGSGYRRGDYRGTLEEVQDNIRRYGAIECCEFIKGWFHETLSQHQSPVLLGFVDVDLEASLDTCVKYLWPRLIGDGYLFTDEGVGTDYVALFWSERWWREHFDQHPPGLIGSGTGLPLGEFYIGPWSERSSHPGQHATPVAYTQKSMSGYWDYYPADRSGGS